MINQIPPLNQTRERPHSPRGHTGPKGGPARRALSSPGVGAQGPLGREKGGLPIGPFGKTRANGQGSGGVHPNGAFPKPPGPGVELHGGVRGPGTRGFLGQPKGLWRTAFFPKPGLLWDPRGGSATARWGPFGDRAFGGSPLLGPPQISRLLGGKNLHFPPPGGRAQFWCSSRGVPHPHERRNLTGKRGGLGTPASWGGPPFFLPQPKGKPPLVAVLGLLSPRLTGGRKRPRARGFCARPKPRGGFLIKNGANQSGIGRGRRKGAGSGSGEKTPKGARGEVPLFPPRGGAPKSPPAGRHRTSPNTGGNIRRPANLRKQNARGAVPARRPGGPNPFSRPWGGEQYL